MFGKSEPAELCCMISDIQSWCRTKLAALCGMQRSGQSRGRGLCQTDGSGELPAGPMEFNIHAAIGQPHPPKATTNTSQHQRMSTLWFITKYGYRTNNSVSRRLGRSDYGYSFSLCCPRSAQPQHVCEWRITRVTQLAPATPLVQDYRCGLSWEVGKLFTSMGSWFRFSRHTQSRSPQQANTDYTTFSEILHGR